MAHHAPSGPRPTYKSEISCGFLRPNNLTSSGILLASVPGIAVACVPQPARETHIPYHTSPDPCSGMGPAEWVCTM